MTAAIKFPTAAALAAKFSAQLAADIGTANVRRAAALNKTSAYADCCASHDFCDANMVMRAACESFGMTFDDVFAADKPAEGVKVWNEAWEIARAAGFRF